jgi:spermidine synthase
VRNGSISRLTFAGMLFCFFFSGAAGLIYQVAWGKSLGLVFGHTVYAIATVLAVFMGGLALGSALIGRWSERFARPVALYAWVEIIIGVSGALSLVGIAGVRGLYLAAYPAASDSPLTLVALRFVASAVVLLLPTFLMGGTLPILVRGLTPAAARSAELGARLSRLYWVNTSGAVAGTLAAGFLLLPAIGLKCTIGVAVGFNLLAGLVALWMNRSIPPAQVLPSTRTAHVAQPLSRFLLVAFAVVGGTAIAYEVAWTRLLAITLGSSTYAFTLMLATFLAGIVLGSALFEWWIKRRGAEPTLGTFALTQSLTALAGVAFMVFFERLPQVVPPILRATQETFGGLILAQFVTSALAMLPAALVFGFNFPVVSVLIAGRKGKSEGHAAAVGRAYAANTLGAIAGATLSGFWLVPKLGAFRVVALMACANLVLAALIELRRPDASGRRWAVLAGNLALLAFIVGVLWSGAFYNRALANFGTVLYFDNYESKLTLAEIAETTDVVFAKDGLNASITVARAEDYIALRTNGKVDASNKDVLTQLLSGHLGAIFHPAPKRVLVIGFGSGMTVSALARYPEVEHIDLVEIEAGVIEAAPFLVSLNHGVLGDPRVHVHIDDGRNFLLTTRESYDLIVSEPSNPWIAGVAALFTEEFYREARARLRPGGMLVQWIQAYALYPEDVKMVLGTFVPQFPQVTLWRGETSDLLMLAQTDPKPLTLDRLRKLWENPALRGDYTQLGWQRPEGIIAFYRLDAADLRRFIAGGVTNTDDNTRLEYRAPRALLAKNLADTNVQKLLEMRASQLPRDVQLDDHRTALLGMVEAYLNLDEVGEAARYASSLATEPPTVESQLALGRLELLRGKMNEARAGFEAALRMDKNSLEAAWGLGEAARRLLQYDNAELLLLQVHGRDPKYLRALDSLVKLERNRERWNEAALWQARRLAVHPDAPAAEYATLGELLLRAGDATHAERELLAALERDPCNYVAHHSLGKIYRDRQRWEQAEHHLELAVRYYPSYEVQDYLDLAEVYRKRGRGAEADQLLAKAQRIFPGEAKLNRPAPPQ